MGFLSYSYLIFLISGQTSEVTVAQEKFWKLNNLFIYLISDQSCEKFLQNFFRAQLNPHGRCQLVYS